MNRSARSVRPAPASTRRPALAAGLLALAALLAAPAAAAFGWEPGVFPEGDSRYVLEMRTGDETADAMRIEIAATDAGGTYDVVTTLTVEQVGLERGQLSDAALGGSALGMIAFGPMAMYGPSFMLLPMLLGDEDIAVRSEPMRVLGVGTLHMDRSEEVAGKTCVVIRLEPDADPSAGMEMAVAEGVPFPCFSRYGEGSDAVEVRLIEATP